MDYLVVYQNRQKFVKNASNITELDLEKRHTHFYYYNLLIYTGYIKKSNPTLTGYRVFIIT